MKKLVLTLDYELYGDGSGDVFKHIIEPTNCILNIARQENIKFTIFFEVVEYWKLKAEWERGNKMGYSENPITAIENQLLQAYKEGHDIQLHIHPQWVNAYWEKDKWNVNFEEWRLGDYKGFGEMSLEKLLQKGKETIEKLITPVDNSYRCIALRAGGYNIQPSMRIVEAMKKNGLVVDSSIYPGGKENTFLSKYDYSSIPPEYGYWSVGKQLEDVGNSNIIEVPITAYPIVRWQKYISVERIKAILRNTKSAKYTFDSKTSSNRHGNFQKIGFFFEEEWQTWDFCLFSKSMHRRFLSYMHTNNRDVYVLVGHPKSFLGSGAFAYLLTKINKRFDILTIRQLYLKIKSSKI